MLLGSSPTLTGSLKLIEDFFGGSKKKLIRREGEKLECYRIESATIPGKFADEFTLWYSEKKKRYYFESIEP